MELCCLPLWAILLLVVLVLLGILYVRHMSSTHGTFQKMGIDSPPASRIMGHFGEVGKRGMFKAQQDFYTMYKDKKVYGVYDMRVPVLVVRDLDMLKDIFVKHFNKFVNRREVIKPDPPFDQSLLSLKDDHWKHVRNAVSPTFTSGRVKRMTPHVQRHVQLLLETLKEKQERNEDIELKDIVLNFTLDVIASTAFGYEVNSLKTPDNEFILKVKKMLKPSLLSVIAFIFLPYLVDILKKFGIYVYARKELEYLIKFVDNAIESRRAGETERVNDFLDLVVNAEKDASEEGQAHQGDDAQNPTWNATTGLTRAEIQAQALTFIFAGMETVATVVSFLLFSLANHPDCCRRAQEEIDEKIGKDMPDFDNIQSLHYLDMCLSEVMRLYPSTPLVDRVCNEEVTLQGVNIPKGMVVMAPIYAIHHDPEIWPDPEKFQPERFSPENKEARHPYAYLPFGHGPRNCIGMRLGQMEVKIAVASVLQVFTPVPCAKTVYPIKLKKIQVAAEDGLWVKLEPRK